MKDYYETLQVSPKAGPEVIAAAYRRLARKYHPDTYAGADASERMRELNEAYEVLSDRARRNAYDHARGQARRETPEPEREPTRRRAREEASKPPRAAKTAARGGGKRRAMPTLSWLVVVVVIGSVITALMWIRVSESDEHANGGALTLEEYFNEIADLKAENDKQADEVQARVEEDLASVESPEEAIEVFGDLIGGFSDVVSGSRDSLDALQPPSEVEDLHDELVAVYRVAADTLEDLAAELDEGIELADFEDFGGRVEAEFSSLGTQSEVVCLQLQDIADENSIDVDLECGGDDE